jgi:hypothetical protein
MNKPQALPLLAQIKCQWPHNNVPRAPELPLTVMPCVTGSSLTMLLMLGCKTTQHGAN